MDPKLFSNMQAVSSIILVLRLELYTTLWLLQADRLAEEERERRIEESKGAYDAEKQKTYNKLVVVQEDLLRTIMTMKVRTQDEEMGWWGASDPRM